MRRRERAAELRQLRADLAEARRRADAAVQTARIAERQREQAQDRVVDLERELAQLRAEHTERDARRPVEGGAARPRPGELTRLRRENQRLRGQVTALEQRLADMQAASEARDRQGATR